MTAAIALWLTFFVFIVADAQETRRLTETLVEKIHEGD